MLPLVLCPGLLCDAALYAHQTRHLADLADPVVAGLTEDDSIAAMARRVLQQAPAGPFALAGLSMGGYVALEICRQAPERVSRLALLSTQAVADTEAQTRRRRALIAMSGHGSFRGITPRLLPLLVHPDRLLDEALTGVLMEMAERIGREGFVRQQTAILTRIDSTPHLPAIACPTLVVTGRQDAVTPLERGQAMAEAIPGARVVVLEDCGHVSALEQPVAVTALLRLWLQGALPAAAVTAAGTGGSQNP